MENLCEWGGPQRLGRTPHGGRSDDDVCLRIPQRLRKRRPLAVNINPNSRSGRGPPSTRSIYLLVAFESEGRLPNAADCMFSMLIRSIVLVVGT